MIVSAERHLRKVRHDQTPFRLCWLAINRDNAHPSGERMVNLINYTVDGVSVPTTNIQISTYNNGSFAGSMSATNP